MKKRFAVFCLAALLTASAAMAAVPTDLTGLSPDFCACFNLVVTNPLIPLLPAEFAYLVDMLKPDNADLNGNSTVVVWPEMDLGLHGNGMLDCKADLKLVESFLKDPTKSVAGLTHADVVAAWNANDAQFLIDIGNYWGILKGFANGLPQILKGFMTIGDGNSQYFYEDPENPEDVTKITTSGSAGFIKAILGMLGEFITNPNIDLTKYSRLPERFAPDGDCDLDGASNQCEFAAYGPGSPGGSNDLYVAYAADPTKVPPCGGPEGEVEGEPTGPCADSDGDQLCDRDESRYGTNVNMYDTDGDGVCDGLEVIFGSDPTRANDTVDLPSANYPGIILLGVCFGIAGVAVAMRRARATK